MKYVDQMVDAIRSNGKNIGGMNMTKWFMWLAFDVIMDLSFGESLKLIEEGTYLNPTIQTVTDLSQVRVTSG